MPRLLAAVAVAAVLLPATATAATVRFERLAGVASPGTPARYDKVGVLKVGRPKARNVLVLNPGTSASAAYFAPLARSVVARSPKWQVWAVERRENLLEDQSRLDQGKAGAATAKQVFDYYLGWLKDGTIQPHATYVKDEDAGFAKQWGMRTEVGDLRRVVLAARERGGKVVVGGHSLGGTITSAYATWDFKGTPGAKGLAGLVFIDGGSSPTALTADDARARLDALDAGSPFLTIGGFPAPLAGLFIAAGSEVTLQAPDAPSDFQASGLLPGDFVPPFPATNAGLYGYALDTETSPAAVALAQAHLGHLATSGDPRGWDDAGELTPLRRMAAAFAGAGLEGLDGAAWYHPARLSLDAGAVAAGNANDAQAVLGVRATHGDDLPRRLRILAFGASLGGTRVLDAARALARQSGIPRRRLTLIDRHATYAHNDPNTAVPKRNAFLKALVPYLRMVATGS